MNRRAYHFKPIHPSGMVSNFLILILFIHFYVSKTKVFLKYWQTEKLAKMLEDVGKSVTHMQKGKRENGLLREGTVG